MNLLDTDRLDAVVVQFKEQIFQDDFPDKGMKAYLVDVKKDWSNSCYELFFDFSSFEEENFKYFKEVYYPNQKTGQGKDFYTAIEAGEYNPKYSVYFGDLEFDEDHPHNDLTEYLKVLEN